MKHNFAEVAVALPIDRTFHYSIPGNMDKDLQVGKRVWVEFRNKDRVGYIVGLSGEAGVGETKPIKGVIDQEPIISGQMMELAGWMSDTYLSSLGEAIDAMVPGVLKKGKTSVRARKEEPSKAVLPTEPFDLTAEQAEALDNVIARIKKEEHKTYLLHGITASGKTEIYLQAVSTILDSGKSSIVLVPEISLTPQTVERFVSRFGSQVAVIHSRLMGSVKFKEWKRIKDGEARIVVGARSAIFSPVKRLGLIIVDEEHETSYKQEDVPRYHARDVAIMRGKLSNCPVILGSATPSLESYYEAKKGNFELVKLTKRIDERSLPRVKIVDMRMELATRKKIVMLSKILQDTLQKVVEKGQQAMIFLNRRGFSTYINCKKCGLVLKCKRCDAVLVYHYAKKLLICHYCDHTQAPPDICPNCRSTYIKYFGIGTEKVESELSRIFPQARFARMDTDATVKRGSHGRILEEFRKHKVDVLVGTQMIAKGHDFPRVTLVGVVNADVTLNLPDFRASERTFNLLTQVAGRAGRGEEGGEVIIQTYAPEHYALRASQKHDYEAFYEEEIKCRKELAFPPFVNIIKITLRARQEWKCKDGSEKLAALLKDRMKNAMVAGPAPSPVSRVRGFYRWNIMLKGKNRSVMCGGLRKALAGYRRPGGTILSVDVDPISM